MLKLFGVLVAVAAVVAAITLFFRMDHIVISGNERYAESEILEASGLKTGGNLYLINKFDVKEAIFAALPYVEEVRIYRKLPDTLMIEVRECKAVAGFADSADGFWLISAQGKLLEHVETLQPGCPAVTGEPPIAPAAGRQMELREEAAYRQSVVLALLHALEERGMSADVSEIAMGDETALSFAYLGRFTVRFPWTADLGYKLDSLDTVVDYLEGNETGCIDLMTEGKASFIPN